MNPNLHVVEIPTDLTAAERLRRSLADIRSAGHRLSLDLIERTEALAREADEIAGLGEAVTPGVREEARRMSAALIASATRMQVIMGRTGR